MAKRKPRLAVWKFASCDGCQLSLLDLEDELLPLAGEVELVHFREATSRSLWGPYDLSLVDGSIATAADAERIRSVRAASRRLVTIGACATSGGIQALRNFARFEAWPKLVYARPEYVDALATSKAVSAYVPVDFELLGCPVNRMQLLEVILAHLHGRPPQVPAHSVCVECKSAGEVCVMVAHGTPCLGPVTHAGCGALCPHHRRGCYGCFGPMETPATRSLSRAFRRLGVGPDELRRAYRSFHADAPAFREAAEAVEDGD